MRVRACCRAVMSNLAGRVDTRADPTNVYCSASLARVPLPYNATMIEQPTDQALTDGPRQLPQRCPRCEPPSMSWVWVAGRRFLCANCYDELTTEREPVNCTPEPVRR